MITPLVNREPIDTFLFTPQLSNNVRASPNKYVVLQQKCIQFLSGATIGISKAALSLSAYFWFMMAALSADQVFNPAPLVMLVLPLLTKSVTQLSGVVILGG